MCAPCVMFTNTFTLALFFVNAMYYLRVLRLLFAYYVDAALESVFDYNDLSLFIPFKSHKILYTLYSGL